MSLLLNQRCNKSRYVILNNLKKKPGVNIKNYNIWEVKIVRTSQKKLTLVCWLRLCKLLCSSRFWPSDCFCNASSTSASECDFIWIWYLSFLANEWEQTTHTCGLSPVCSRMCLFKVPMLLNTFSQCKQEKVDDSLESLGWFSDVKTGSHMTISSSFLSTQMCYFSNLENKNIALFLKS